jgi:cobalt/nickel transport system permease protein
MHIFDGYLSPAVCAATGAASLGAVSYSLHRLKDTLADRTVPLTGMMAALIFAGQMVNFPLPGVPVSGHLLGGVLAAVLLGPWAGCLALTMVVVVQCLLFSDGGLLSLGANILHMAVIGPIAGYGIYVAVRNLTGRGRRGTILAAAVAAWLGVMLAAVLFCLEFQLSWRSEEFDVSRVFVLMLLFHAVIGVGEALITGSIVGFVLTQSPELMYSPAECSPFFAGKRRAVAVGVLAALLIAVFLAPFASSFPDGLEAVAQRAGVDQLANFGLGGVLPDYEVPLPESWRRLSAPLAGVAGTATVLMLALVVGRGLKNRASVVGQRDEP